MIFLSKISLIGSKIKKLYHKHILKRKYFRHGKCKMCGACCQNIYVRHSNKIIESQEEFDKIRECDDYSFYKHIEVVGKDDFGLIFSCNKFDKDKKLCTDHKNRPPICRNYPSEEIFSFGACLQDDCGYSFTPIESFEEVFNKVLKRPVKNFEEYKEEISSCNTDDY